MATRLGGYIGQLLNPFNDALQATSNLLQSPATHRAVVRSLILGAVFTFCCVSAVIAYLVFYWIYIPDFGLSEPIWLQYGHSRPPFAIIDLLPEGGYLANDQSYDVSVDLFVPVSEKNLDIGNFMVTFDLRASDNSSLFVASRPASLNYASGPARVVQDLTSVKTLLGFQRAQAQHLTVRIVDRQILQRRGDRKRISHAMVEVGRADAYLPSRLAQNNIRGELQVYKSKLHFDAHFEGLRYFMYHHTFLAFIIFSTLFLGTQFCAALAAWGIIAYRRGTILPFDSSSVSNKIRRSSSSEDDKAKIRRRIEQADARELAERRRRQVERDLLQGNRMHEGDGEPLMDDEDDEIETEVDERDTEVEDSLQENVEELSREASDKDGSSSGWQDVDAPVETFLKPKDDDSGEMTVGGSSTSRGAESSLRSFTPSTTTTSTSAPRSLAPVIESGTATPSDDDGH